MWTERRDMDDDPLSFLLHLVMDSRISTRNYIKYLLESVNNDISEASNKLIQDVISSDSSKCMYYLVFYHTHLSIEDGIFFKLAKD